MDVDIRKMLAKRLVIACLLFYLGMMFFLRENWRIDTRLEAVILMYVSTTMLAVSFFFLYTVTRDILRLRRGREVGAYLTCKNLIHPRRDLLFFIICTIFGIIGLVSEMFFSDSDLMLVVIGAGALQGVGIVALWDYAKGRCR